MTDAVSRIVTLVTDATMEYDCVGRATLWLSRSILPCLTAARHSVNLDLHLRVDAGEPSYHT